jgi:hypothetical protein
MHVITSDNCVLRKIFPNDASSAACSVWCGNAHGFGFYATFNYILNFCCYRISLHIAQCMLELSACKVAHPHFYVKG